MLAFLDQQGIGIDSMGRVISTSVVNGTVTLVIDGPDGSVESTLGRDITKLICVEALPPM